MHALRRGAKSAASAAAALGLCSGERPQGPRGACLLGARASPGECVRVQLYVLANKGYHEEDTPDFTGDRVDIVQATQRCATKVRPVGWA